LKKITGIYELSVPLEGDITNSVVNFSAHDVSLVAVASNVFRLGRPVIGYGFNSIGRFAQTGILQGRMIPRILNAEPASLVTENGDFFDPAVISSMAMSNEKPGGHGDRSGALAAIELAIWDLNAKLADEPAWSWISKCHSTRVERLEVSTYAAGGYYYSTDSLVRLKDELHRYRDLGFDAFKIKIGGASLEADLDRIDTAVELAGWGKRVAVDANGRFDTETAVRYLESMSARGLRWFEEPGDPLDFELLSQLSQMTDIPLATGENLFSVQDTRNLLLYGGMKPGRDIFQMDAGLSYGLTEYVRMLGQLESAGMHRNQCFPHGGHLINLHIAAGLNLGGCEAYPGVFGPFGGFSPTCAISDGSVKPSDAPGFGLEEKPELLPYINKLSEAF
jgi:L-alanine-DL-glutamate epimerase-like enolase superfamily enzyme